MPPRRESDDRFPVLCADVATLRDNEDKRGAALLRYVMQRMHIMKTIGGAVLIGIDLSAAQLEQLEQWGANQCDDEEDRW